MIWMSWLWSGKHAGFWFRVLLNYHWESLRNQWTWSQRFDIFNLSVFITVPEMHLFAHALCMCSKYFLLSVIQSKSLTSTSWHLMSGCTGNVWAEHAQPDTNMFESENAGGFKDVVSLKVRTYLCDFAFKHDVMVPVLCGKGAQICVVL